jgi:ATP-dependent Clp protease ATP-binding subunit ClpA
MIEYVKVFHFYRTALIRSIRLIVFFVLVFSAITQYTEGSNYKTPLFLFCLFLMFEIFFRFKIGKVLPDVVVEKNPGTDVSKSFTREALGPFVSEITSDGVVRKIAKSPTVRIFLEKANILPDELPQLTVDKKVLMKSAFETAKTFKGKYVTTTDVLIAYLLLIENDNKILFAKQLKSEDLYNISYWIRQNYPREENPKKVRVNMYGTGIGEALTTGWTYETKNYTAPFTKALNRRPLIIGREGEFREVLEGLIKVESNNVLIVGDIGAGKENLVRALAYYSYEGELGTFLNHRRILEVMVGALVAGASNRSELEERIEAIIAEVSHADDVILYVPEFQNVLGASSFGLDLSGALLPFLKAGSLPIISTMTTGTYKKYMERNPLRQAFSVIELKTPDKNTAIQMALSESDAIEKRYNVILSYLSIKSSIDLSERFIQDQVLPGSAIALLDTIANKVRNSKDIKNFGKTKKKMVLENHIVTEVEHVKNVAIGLPTDSEIELLLHLEEKMHKRVIEQDEAIKALAEAMRRVRSGLKTSAKPVSFLFLGPTGVGKTETAKSLSEFYYGGEKNMIRLDMSEYSDEDGLKRLLGAVPGQGDERGELTDKIHDNPGSLVLLDEFEKAHPKIHNLFLQVLDDGRLTDNKGVTVNFGNAIIIATSNAGSEFIREAVEKGEKIDEKFEKKLLEELQKNNLFRPELLNRFDGVITFKPLSGKQVMAVVELMLNELTAALEKQDIKLKFDQAVLEKIATEGFDKEFGARPLRRYIQDNIEDMIAQKKLTKELDRGKTAKFSIDGTGALQVTVS